MRCNRMLGLGGILMWGAAASAQPAVEVDLNGLSTSTHVHRTHGSAGTGASGVPVAGGFDCDGDGHRDSAMAAMRASPMSRTEAGEIYLVFGDGTTSGTLDTAVVQERILRFAGVVTQENAGSEIWMDDVTGDGLGDLLIARQNFSSGGRIGNGALTIIVGAASLRTQSQALALSDDYFDLGSPPAGSTITTIEGANTLDRLGIWMRTGDVTGDGVADIVVGADQQLNNAEVHAGVVYVIRGGSHLAANQTIDLASFGTTALAGNLARVTPPNSSGEHHFGATVQIADLDGNSRGEVLIATALNRAGAALDPSGAPGGGHPVGGSTDGSVYILWDDNFPAGVWTAGLTLDASSLPGSRTLIHGGIKNVSFGEELLGGLDFDGDTNADLFVGDLAGDLSSLMNRSFSGSGHVLYNAATLKGLTFDMDNPPMGLVTSTFVGAEGGDIAGDTAAQGDIDGDGIGDLVFSAPHGSPFGRNEAGIVYVLFGASGGWPSFVDLFPSAIPDPSVLRMATLYGANGASGDAGDVLSYSAAAGDIDGDGRTDLITNEMQGNGVLPGTEDTGNLIIVSGRRLSGQICRLDVDASGAVVGATDGVYVFRHLSGLITVVPVSFRTVDPLIPIDLVVAANIDAMGMDLDVDDNGSLVAATDGVYIFRRLLGLETIVPLPFRGLDPSIPSDEVIAANIDALCPN